MDILEFQLGDSRPEFHVYSTIVFHYHDNGEG